MIQTTTLASRLAYACNVETVLLFCQYGVRFERSLRLVPFVPRIAVDPQTPHQSRSATARAICLEPTRSRRSMTVLLQ